MKSLALILIAVVLCGAAVPVDKYRYATGERPVAGDRIKVAPNEDMSWLNHDEVYVVERLVYGANIFLTEGGGDYFPKRFVLIERASQPSTRSKPIWSRFVRWFNK